MWVTRQLGNRYHHLRFPFLLILVSTLFLLTPTGRAHTRAALLVADLLSPAEASLLHLVTRPVTGEDVALRTVAGQTDARYYRPADDGPAPALILVSGYPSDIGDPQLNRLGEDLARLGFAVLIPRLPGLRVGSLLSEDVDVLVGAFQWLAARPEVNAEKVGYAGFCVGSSLALLAAQDARINEVVALVNVFGGYYDLTQVMRATAAHSVLYENQEIPWQPSRATVTLFAQNLLRHVSSEERVRLQEWLEGRETAELTNTTSKWVYAMSSTTEPAHVDRLLSQIPEAYNRDLMRLSPSAGIDQLHARLFIMHDSSDPYIPSQESYRLAGAVNDPSRVIRAEFRLFEHVRPQPMPEQLELVGEGIKLIRYLGKLFYYLSSG